MPGPGQYLETNQLCTIGEKDTYSFGKNTRFAEPARKATSLGPGQYAVGRLPEFSEKYKCKPSSIFASRTKRTFEAVSEAASLIHGGETPELDADVGNDANKSYDQSVSNGVWKPL